MNANKIQWGTILVRSARGMTQSPDSNYEKKSKSPAKKNSGSSPKRTKLPKKYQIQTDWS